MSPPDTPLQPVAEAPSPSTIDRGADEPGSRLMLIIGTGIVGAVLSIAAAHAPARIRLLGLFSLAFGLLVGWAAIQLAQRMRCRVGPIEIAVIGCITFAGLIGSTWQSFRLEPEPKVDERTHPIMSAVENEMRKQQGLPQQGLPKRAVVDSTVERFRAYLGRRIQALGTWNRPWPEVFWGCEVLIGTAGTVWIAWRHLRQEVKA